MPRLECLSGTGCRQFESTSVGFRSRSGVRSSITTFDFTMQAARSARMLVSRNARSYHGKHSDFKAPSMDELPVPAGSWSDAFAARQRRNNLTLIGGIIFAGASIFTAKTSGLIYLNFSPPDSID
ncbi:cytochrome c oxidase subunit 7B [Arctopsyche grandis]|uniref:cytochrome c oxidase subunit 7B n=1 Tax=Arctopsyche grandis TaxID=121162 RepID=UPI00406D755A